MIFGIRPGEKQPQELNLGRSAAVGRGRRRGAAAARRQRGSEKRGTEKRGAEKRGAEKRGTEKRGTEKRGAWRWVERHVQEVLSI